MFCWPGLAWNGGAACWYKIFNLKVSETASQQLDSIPFIAVHNPLTTLQLLCTKQLSWKIYMSSLNQDDIVKTTVHQLTCRFDKTEQLSAITLCPLPWYGWVNLKVVAVVHPKGLTNSFVDIGSLPSYSWGFKTICEAASARFLISFPTGVGFCVVLILPGKFLWNDLIIHLSNVT